MPTMTARRQQNTRKLQGKPENLTNAGKGRKKGVPNKFTLQVKEMVLAALDKAGGPEYLYKQSLENPTAFMTLVGKIIPLQVTGQDDGPIKITIERRIVSK